MGCWRISNEIKKKNEVLPKNIEFNTPLNNMFIYLHFYLDGKSVYFINSKYLTKASTSAVQFSYKLFCFYRLLCMLFSLLQNFLFKKLSPTPPTKKAILLFYIKLLSWDTMGKILKMFVDMLLYTSNHFMLI